MTHKNKENKNKMITNNQTTASKQANTNKQIISKKKDGGFYARRPIEEVKAFKSKDGKSFVVQVIKTCIFPTNYIRTIIENESPYKAQGSKKEVSGSGK